MRFQQKGFPQGRKEKVPAEKAEGQRKRLNRDMDDGSDEDDNIV